jgi:hypothetical protein
MIRRILINVLSLALVLMPGISSVIEASNSTSQEASTNMFSCLEIVSKSSNTAVTTITFPMGDPGSIVSNPYNDVDGAEDPQLLAASLSEPVVRFYNPTESQMWFSLEISDWTNGVVTSERFKVAIESERNITAVDRVLSTDGKAATVSQASLLAGGAYKCMYFEITLCDQADVTGTSTITVMGELY